MIIKCALFAEIQSSIKPNFTTFDHCYIPNVTIAMNIDGLLTENYSSIETDMQTCIDNTYKTLGNQCHVLSTLLHTALFTEE